MTNNPRIPTILTTQSSAPRDGGRGENLRFSRRERGGAPGRRRGQRAAQVGARRVERGLRAALMGCVGWLRKGVVRLVSPWGEDDMWYFAMGVCSAFVVVGFYGGVVY